MWELRWMPKTRWRQSYRAAKKMCGSTLPCTDKACRHVTVGWRFSTRRRMTRSPVLKFTEPNDGHNGGLAAPRPTRSSSGSERTRTWPHYPRSRSVFDEEWSNAWTNISPQAGLRSGAAAGRPRGRQIAAAHRMIGAGPWRVVEEASPGAGVDIDGDVARA